MRASAYLRVPMGEEGRRGSFIERGDIVLRLLYSSFARCQCPRSQLPRSMARLRKVGTRKRVESSRG